MDGTFLWNFKCSLCNVGQNILPIHWKKYILFNKENVTTMSHEPVLKRAPDKSSIKPMAPMEKRQTHGRACDPLWVVLEWISYQMSNFRTIHSYLVCYKMHFHIGLSSVQGLDLHYKATTSHSHSAWLTSWQPDSHILYGILHRPILHYFDWYQTGFWIALIIEELVMFYIVGCEIPFSQSFVMCKLLNLRCKDRKTYT